MKEGRIGRNRVSALGSAWSHASHFSAAGKGRSEDLAWKGRISLSCKRALSARGAHAPRVRPTAPRGRERRAPSRVVLGAGSHLARWRAVCG